MSRTDSRLGEYVAYHGCGCGCEYSTLCTLMGCGMGFQFSAFRLSEEQHYHKISSVRYFCGSVVHVLFNIVTGQLLPIPHVLICHCVCHSRTRNSAWPVPFATLRFQFFTPVDGPYHTFYLVSTTRYGI